MQSWVWRWLLDFVANQSSKLPPGFFFGHGRDMVRDGAHDSRSAAVLFEPFLERGRKEFLMIPGMCSLKQDSEQRFDDSLWPARDGRSRNAR